MRVRTLPRRAAAVLTVAVVLTVATVGALAGCGTIPPDDPVSNGATLPGASCDYVETGSPAKPNPMPSMYGVPTAGTVRFTLTTNQGAITITSDRAAAPCTVNSFSALVAAKYFDDTPCHRLTNRGIFVLQCGDPTGSGTGGPGYTIPDETTGKETYSAGTVAMARTSDPHSGGSQFFLVYDDSDLPPSYTIFGHVDAAGLAVLRKIAQGGDDSSNGPGDGRPLLPVTILTATQS